MTLRLFNSLVRKKEKFCPMLTNSVTMYVCGPTVYDRPHIGNARSVVCYDVLYRVLRHIYGEGQVRYVRNITDIDDKIIDRATKKNISVSELTINTTKLFHSDMQYLYCLSPNHEPRATESIADIIAIITKLLDLKVAYIAQGHVYFDVSKYKDYSKLSRQSELELLDSVRIEQSLGKKNNADFVLWKPAKKNECNFSAFDSPFGYGRPGWHIECSAMSYKFFGENFDIHGGGVDLIFPHHTNEIAQSCSAFPGSSYAKYWVHNGFLTINREKMSKSLGNFLTVKDLIDKKVHGEIIRLFLISSHYRKPLDYNEKAITDSANRLNYWYRAIELSDGIFEQNITSPSEEFMNALYDDLNTYKAITIINELAKKIHLEKDKQLRLEFCKKMLACANLLGLLNHRPEEWFHNNSDKNEIEELINQRIQAKTLKDWAKADKIRHQLTKMGISLEDKPNNKTTWKKIT